MAIMDIFALHHIRISITMFYAFIIYTHNI